MLDFLFKNYFLITHILEATTAVIGLFCLKKFKDTAVVFFIKILVFLFFVDFLGSYTLYLDNFEFFKPIKGTKFAYNTWWFTLFFDVLAVSFLTFFYIKLFKNILLKKIIKIILLSFWIYCFAKVIYDFDSLFYTSDPVIYIFGAILIIGCTSIYFIQLLQNEDLLKFSTSPYFYISISLFLWWLIVTPLVFYDKYYILEDKSFINLKRSIYVFSNLFMYSIFAFGLLVSRREQIK
ncbi:hypothetical protein [uncultured Olleya sp.]|uniref:hypothetical protein n=1 Tax=uncultured Olleya sp. TaxID=757243 RepID=UPI00259A025E|nr:hypothetical protein [uncultured Olleya sp.]